MQPAGIMTPRLAQIWRHTVKSVGCEPLERVTLFAGAPLPHDRRWAIAHGASEWNANAPGWAACNNFLRVTQIPALAAVSAQFEEETGALTLSHPARPTNTFRPASREGAVALLEWIAPLAADGRPGPYRLAHAPSAMTDAPEPYVSILSLDSLRALSQRLEATLDPRRFRGNLWVEGWRPWDEEELIGRTFTVGPARLRVVEPIGRCRATEANPDTGRHDAPVIDTLREARGHTAFGLYAEVVEGGEIVRGTPVEVLS